MKDAILGEILASNTPAGIYGGGSDLSSSVLLGWILLHFFLFLKKNPAPSLV